MKINIEKIRKAFGKLRKKTMKAAEKMNKTKEEKEVVFADTDRDITKAEVPRTVTVQNGEEKEGWLVLGNANLTIVESKDNKYGRKIQKQRKRMYNRGNNKRKMKGKPLRRYIAKRKAEKKKCPIRTHKVENVKIYAKKDGKCPNRTR